MNVFHQIYNPKVQEQYLKDNYDIEYDQTQRPTRCAIYFSGNSLYYPNTEEVFLDTIINKDRYEWKQNKLKNVHKHIFIRDIFKQWYLLGINKRINSIEKLIAFLEKETQGYKTTCIGGSAGGYAAALLGCMIDAQTAFTFNGQFEIATLLENERERVLNPALAENETNNKINKFFNIVPYITNKKTQIYYFSSAFSSWDNQQYEVVKSINNIKTIRFKSKIHGIPFELTDLHATLHIEGRILRNIDSVAPITPLQYSIKLNGLLRTIIMRLLRKLS